MKLQQAEPIAIVGSGCRFPGGADSPSALWQLLKQPRDVVQEIPTERFDTTGFFHADARHHSTSNVRHAYLLEQDLRVFDTQFFFISPNEADSMDPQQRLLLETVYEALEAGGHSLEALRGSDTAVYVGTMGVDWNDIAIRELDTMPTYFATGTNRAIISNRVSYFFDWHGPSMTIDTACSSSLVAVHQGVQALRTGESRVAVACGTQVILGPETFIIESKMKMLSPTGRSRMWDADADGYARGEGVAAIVMKRLSDALADGDEVQCLIRETGSNQDGYSNGLTVPSSAAQAALIRMTYAKAGLDLSASRDRPQYFEAHGTGTQAGDPKEAGAIFECFGNSDSGSGSDSARGAPLLYVGSAKTVIGHTEGAAGLAGLLKAAASIQNGFIPPNLLFNRLNPAIEPFYQSLRVPTSLIPWPELSPDVPRRASVNSFGFGGSNAHAILEQYLEGPVAPANFNPAASTLVSTSAIPVTPFLFSAASEPSLISQLQAYSTHLKAHPDINLHDLALTLQARRSQLAVKTAFTASSIEELTSKIDERLASAKQNGSLGTRSNTGTANTTKASILGVFTGQGAQWATMGAHLISTSPGFVSKRIQDLENYLTTLPAADRPQWSLRNEILADSETSRIAEAALSQPLCTALQIVLVDLLRTAGITFSAVVGHSSGEIAAAYAAGYLSDRDAMRVAYYRGLYAHLAGSVVNDTEGTTKAVGAMLAVGTSLDDARDLINLSAFKGSLAIAAHNSSASVTLSGDVNAVLLAKKVFDEEKKFARLLKVDTAYHSHHMAPCSDPYVSALRKCSVTILQDQRSDCVWFSSVVPDAHGMNPVKELQDVYWRDNMSQTVLFADAIKNAVTSNPQISLAIEVGPHPALKGPAIQNIADVRAAALPYHGVLNRGQNDIEAFAQALGFIWTQLGAQSVDFDTYRKTMNALPDHVSQTTFRQPKLVTGLPSYQWNHTRRHWHESRRSVKLRERKQPFHELLGILLPESTARDLRWKNILKSSEIPWLEGHQLQGQTVFPAAGYVAMALEGGRFLATSSKVTVELFELHDLAIPKAIAFDEGDNSGAETLVTLTGVHSHSSNIVTADFSCYSCPVSNSGSEAHEMELMASGTMKLVIGTPDATALCSPLVPDTSNMGDVNTERFYSSLTDLGYDYNGPFRTMSAMKRRLNQSSAFVSTYPYDRDSDSDATYLVHPSLLDVAFQVAFLAYAAPGDGRLWSLHVPTAIGRIRVNPEQSAALPISGTDVPVWCTVTSGKKAREPFSASIDILNHDSDATTRSSNSSMVQVEDLVLKPFAPATAADDRSLFTSTKWHVASPDGSAAVQGLSPTDEQAALARLCERVSFHYLKKWKAELSDDEWNNGQPHFRSLRNFVNHTLEMAAKGQHPTAKHEWASDTPEDVVSFLKEYPESIDLQLISAVGEHMVAAVRGETTIIEHMIAGNMLDDYYARGGDSAPMNVASAAMVKQITHRYPHARILEIGAGTGGATKKVFEAIGTTMSSYTYTDISTGFFDKATEVFEAFSDRMVFKVLDVERPPASQGFEAHSYDIVIANNVLHATSVLQRTLENTRQLLKPGGWLILAELSNKGPVRFGTIMGGLQGWWAGVDDGRKHMPIMTPVEWHSVLRSAGFGGVDAVTPELDCHATLPWSIIAAQAVDDRINLLRRPLLAKPASTSSPMFLDSIVILGTRSLESARISEELAEHLSRFSHRVTILDGLPTEEEAQSLDPTSSFINLVDLDQPIFKDITGARMEAIKRVFELARNILWVTNGAISAENPYHMASVTFRRVISNEAQHICLHHLDLTSLTSDQNVSKTIAEELLRQSALDEWEREAPSTDKIRNTAFLWSKEPEIFVDKCGRPMIPRLMHNTAQNARLNSVRRVIARNVQAESLENVSIVIRNDGCPTIVAEDLSVSSTQIGKVQAESSSLMALNTAAEGFLFLGIGKEIYNKANQVIFLSTTNSLMTTPVVSIPLPAVGHDHLHILSAVASELVAESVIHTLPSGSNLVVHSVASGKDQILADALRRQAEYKTVRTAFITTANLASDSIPNSTCGPEWIKLNNRAPKHALKHLLPFQATHLLDLAATSNHETSTVAPLLPALTRLVRLDDLARFEAHTIHPSRKQVLLNRLQDAFTNAISTSRLTKTNDTMIPLDQIRLKTHASLSDIVRWTFMTSDHIQADVRPLDAQHLFAKNKSYLLLGLTSEIGRSLCEWMVANGAGCVCLASRTPKANDSWLQIFKGAGANVKLYAVDVADKASLGSLIDKIRTECPPISGIVNGAMVLRDSLFSKMSVDQMQAVLRPKIEGSNNLDELFYKDPLDFFLLLSSATALIGNPGQSSYVISSGYLNGLVRQRRRRGLAASAVDIGRVAGLGYVETAGEHVVNQLTNFRLLPISETELHQVFAEAIHAGYPDSRSADDADGVSFPEAIVTTGLGTIRDDEEVRGPYFENPLFSHCIIETAGLAVSGVDQPDGNKKTGSSLPILDQLAIETSYEHALTLLQDSFAAKLCSILQITSGTPDHDAPLVELGMDSLVAVEARSWFLKNLKVDIPVLKIVGGSSLAEICQLAFKKLPEDLLADIGTGESMPAKSVVPPAQPQVPNLLPQPSASTASSTDDSTPNLQGSTVDTPLSSVAAMSLEYLHKGVSNSVKLSATSETASKTFIKSEPISISQSRFWFLRLLVEDPTTFNVALRYQMTGHVRVGDLERALRAVTARHESLRTCFIGDENELDQASQKILARSPIKLEHKKIQSVEEATAEYDQLRAHEFDLASGSLLRMMLLTLSPTSHYLLVNAHHIIMDVTSFQVLLSDIEKAYNGDHLGSRPRQYPEFSVTQRRAVEEGNLSNELNFWRSIFPATDPPPVLPLLPMARSSSRIAIANYEVHQVDTRIELGLASRIRSVAKAHLSTPFHFYLAAFKAMLFCFINADVQDLTIGIADANRNDSDLIGSIGFFMNLLTLRFRRQPRQSFADAVVEARNTAHAALEHSRLPFDVLLKELKVTRSSSYTPFFQAFFDYRQIDRGRQTWLQCLFDVEDYHPGRSGYDISLDVADLGPEVQIALRVQQSFYDMTAAKLLLETYTHVIEVLSRDPSLFLQDTPLYGHEQLSRALRVGYGPDLVTDWPETLPHRIDLVTQNNADQIALKDGLRNSLTYSTMGQRVEALAEALLKAGAGPSSRVLVFQQASTDWICSMLAIMRIGGIYVPLDLRNPISRLATLSSDCRPTAVLADDITVGDAPQLGVSVIINISEVASAPSVPVPNIARSDSPAAILYTSGSTGTPKGIVIRHSGIRNEMEGYTKTYGLRAERVLQQSAFTFDFSVDQMFTGLVNGGMVYIVPYTKRGDPISITEIIQKESITYTKVTPSEYSMWLEFGLDNLRHAPSWRFAFAGGEPLTNHVLQQFSTLNLSQLRLYNSYGPAEISIASHKGLVDYNVERLHDEDPISCGFSLPNYSTYILDENLKPMPVGMPGEVVIGGPGVSNGYLTDQERTASVFVQNPYATPTQIANGWIWMHRTGDIGHLQADGSLTFRHRIVGDTQVKLRGLRIDLRDIETNLVSAADGALKAAVVTLRKGDPDFLVAHVVFSPQHNMENRDVFLEHLLGRLPIPQYMVPVLAVPLDEFPLTNHAKIDRKAILNLGLPRRVVIDDQSDAQLTETMAQLRQLWREVLGKGSENLGPKVSLSTNFFMIGGNSLLIVRLQSRIRQAFDVTVRLVDLLSANTLEQMARKVEQSAQVGVINWEEETKPQSIPSSQIQVRNVEKKGHMTILITGATGNLAKRLLPLLKAHSKVGRIFCVAVRDKPSEASRALLRAEKIVQYAGDLSAPRLGLSEQEFQTLSREVDVILHLGAVRSFWDNYHMLRLSNVQSTRELVQLAAPHQIPIHFVSTSGVLPRDILAVTGVAPSAAPYEPPSDGSDGYCASKWTSERLLERATEDLGVPSFIYRLHPPAHFPQSQQLKTGALDEFVRCVDLASAMPDCTGWEGHVDLIPGEQVARGLCDSLVSSARSTVSPGPTKTQFIRHDSTVTVSVDDIKTYLEEKRGKAGLERLQILKWMGRVKAVGFSYIIASLETTLGDGKGEDKLMSRR